MIGKYKCFIMVLKISHLKISKMGQFRPFLITIDIVMAIK